MDMRNALSWAGLLVLGLFLAACGRESAAPASPGAKAAAGRQVYQVKGLVQEVLPERKKVRIAHEAIPNYMEAMTMMFEVKDPALLTGLQPGDTVSFQMVVTEDDGWIERIQRLDGPRTPLAPAPAPLRRVREVEPLVVGDKLPNYTFTNAVGRVVQFQDYPGQALALTFIFTRCPFPTFCPRLSSNFAEAQKQLASTAGSPTNWHFFSITIDPEYDTPERLKAYAERYQADPKRWDFVTGELIDITAIGEQFGLQFWRSNPAEPINHNVRTVVVDAAGRVQWISVENEWKAPALVEQVVRAAQVKPNP
jgi:protein SCO1/2